MKSNNQKKNIFKNLALVAVACSSIALFYAGYKFTAVKIESSRPDLELTARGTNAGLGAEKLPLEIEARKDVTQPNEKQVNAANKNQAPEHSLGQEAQRNTPPQSELQTSLNGLPNPSTPEQAKSAQIALLGGDNSSDFELEKQKQLNELTKNKLSRHKEKGLSDVEFQNELRKQETQRNAISNFTEKDYKELKIQFPEVKDFKELALIKFNGEADNAKLREATQKPKKKMTEAQRLQKEHDELKKIKAEMGMPEPVEKLSAELYDPWEHELEKIVSKEEKAALQAAKQALEARKAEAKMRKKASAHAASASDAVPD